MGKRSADIEREIAEHRQNITRKRTQLEDRVRTDVHDARVSVTDEIAERTKLGEYARERPLMTLAAAFGAGVLLGGVTDSGGGGGKESHDGGREPRTVRYRREANGSGDGLVASLLGSITGPVGFTLQDEVRSAIRDVFGRDGSSGGTETSAPREQQRFTM
jgi:hypothetical protein